MRKFKNSFPGYNKKEVNSFVGNVTTEYENMLNNLKNKDVEIERKSKELEYYKRIENTLNKAIYVTETTSKDIKEKAYKESNMIIEEARKNASRIINSALMKADKVEREAEVLKRQVEKYKMKYKDILEDQLDQIERIELDN